MAAYIYIVRCVDDSLYTGWTNDVIRRVEMHNLGRGAKYTRGRRPVELVYFEELPDKQAAQRREYAVKQLTHQQKLCLIDNYLQSGEIINKKS